MRSFRSQLFFWALAPRVKFCPETFFSFPKLFFAKMIFESVVFDFLFFQNYFFRTWFSHLQRFSFFIFPKLFFPNKIFASTVFVFCFSKIVFFWTWFSHLQRFSFLKLSLAPCFNIFLEYTVYTISGRNRFVSNFQFVVNLNFDANASNFLFSK